MFAAIGVDQLFAAVGSLASEGFDAALSMLAHEQQAGVLDVFVEFRCRIFETFQAKLAFWQYLPWKLMAGFAGYFTLPLDVVKKKCTSA